MGAPVVHFEITGPDPTKLRNFYGTLFGWEFDTSAPIADAISLYTGDVTGIPGASAAGPAAKVTSCSMWAACAGWAR